MNSASAVSGSEMDDDAVPEPTVGVGILIFNEED